MLEIIYQDTHLVAINKPSGLLVHRSMIDRHETRFAVQLLRDQLGQKVFPVHRLDKPTSGILLFALDSTTARQLNEQFTERATHKTYQALVRGYTAPEGIIDYALQEQLDTIADALADQDKPAQSAITHYRLLETFELPFALGQHNTSRYSLIELTPHTGRKHQLRRHMKHIFHPIVGDTTHGDGKHNRLFREQFNCQRLMLHASQLELQHPHSGATLALNAPPDEDFLRVVQAVRASAQTLAQTTNHS